MNSNDLTRREQHRIQGKWVIQSYDGEIDVDSASDSEDAAWEMFLERCTAPRERFQADGWKAVQMP